MIYPIVAYGDPVLKKLAVEVKTDELDIKKLADDMFETMYEAGGVGLAAPQIGLSIRFFVVDGEPMDEVQLKGFKKVFVNPKIVEESGELWSFNEGCLSIPSIREDIKRPSEVLLHYFDESGNEFTEKFDGLKARIIQHEYDHIEGKLFTDRISELKKRVLKKKLGNISRGDVDVNYKMKFPLKR
ncbi:MAG: peptide deformylase [Cytophagales bacterium]|nr:peptide deformylase [Cytophagales bacterium]